MERLTHKRSSGIKTGYWSPAKKEELVQRLAAYEDTGLDPEQIRELDKLYAELCKELAKYRWISVTERLPQVEDGITDEECPEFIVVIKDATASTTLKYSPDGTWFDDNGYVYSVVAWMPLPDPYKDEIVRGSKGVSEG